MLKVQSNSVISCLPVPANYMFFLQNKQLTSDAILHRKWKCDPQNVISLETKIESRLLLITCHNLDNIKPANDEKINI